MIGTWLASAPPKASARTLTPDATHGVCSLAKHPRSRPAPRPACALRRAACLGGSPVELGADRIPIPSPDGSEHRSDLIGLLMSHDTVTNPHFDIRDRVRLGFRERRLCTRQSLVFFVPSILAAWCKLIHTSYRLITPVADRIDLSESNLGQNKQVSIFAHQMNRSTLPPRISSSMHHSSRRDRFKEPHSMSWPSIHCGFL